MLTTRHLEREGLGQIHLSITEELSFELMDGFALIPL